MELGESNIFNEDHNKNENISLITTTSTTTTTKAFKFDRRWQENATYIIIICFSSQRPKKLSKFLAFLIVEQQFCKKCFWLFGTLRGRQNDVT